MMECLPISTKLLKGIKVKGSMRIGEFGCPGSSVNQVLILRVNIFLLKYQVVKSTFGRGSSLPHN